jgi:cold shock CspA family protein
VKHFGTIVNVHPSYCFVRSEISGENYFLHHKQLSPLDWPNAEVGQVVEFTAAKNTRGLCATNAVVVG